MKKLLLMCCSCIAFMHIFSQPVFTYGSNEVSKEEFVRAFTKNITHFDDREKSLREYIDLYSKFKLKVKAAKDLKLDTLDQLKYDMMNFRTQLLGEYNADKKEAMAKTSYKKNLTLKETELFRYSDSVTLIPESRKYPIAKEVLFTMSGTSVKVGEWLSFVKAYKQNYELYKGESYGQLLEKFIAGTVMDYYRKNLEQFNPDFKYQMQEFKEGNLMFEAMGKKVWNKSTDDNEGLKAFYEANKERFVWGESADVILINAKSYAYADYAAENLAKGMSWKKIADNSEGQIQSDSARFELWQLPVKPGTKLTEGGITAIAKSETDNSASFVKVLKLHPAKQQRTFEEAKSLVINAYQQQLEEKWMQELAQKYPVKVNPAVFQSLIK
jgi:peptidyl-prolyl cis-trans isomerase SurA